VNLYGLTNGKGAVLWAQNALHNWKNVADRKSIPVIQGAVTTVRGLPSGRYTIEWWDTWKVSSRNERRRCARTTR
jgi:hypothetical protein